LQGLLHRRVYQTQAGGKGDPCSEGTQGPIGLEKAVGRTRSREKDGLQKTLQSDIDPSDTVKDCASATLLEHLEGDGAGCLTGGRCSG
jgi:hypothetical protein